MKYPELFQLSSLDCFYSHFCGEYPVACPSEVWKFPKHQGMGTVADFLLFVFWSL